MSAPNAFPWTVGGLTIQTRGALESTIEKLANGGSKQQLAAAHDLLKEARAQQKLTSDQVADIKERLHL